MTENTRLPWVKGHQPGYFRAYPAGMTAAFASIEYSVGRPAAARWRWTIYWPRRFELEGLAAEKQEAADAATAAWWRMMACTVEVVDPNIAMLAMLDTILEKPHGMDIASLPSDYLRRVMWHITQRWTKEIRDETTPRPVAELISEMSVELFRRRTGGKGSPI